MGHPDLSVRQQCDLLGLPRATYYYEPLPESAANLALMARIDRTYTDYPFYGSRRMAVVLSTPEEPVNRKRVQRLMQLMGLVALYPSRSCRRVLRPRCTRTYCAT